ncbi:hypothetical protein ACE6H2_020788 [Prunus campanulata]
MVSGHSSSKSSSRPPKYFRPLKLGLEFTTSPWVLAMVTDYERDSGCMKAMGTKQKQKLRQKQKQNQKQHSKQVSRPTNSTITNSLPYVTLLCK